MPLLLDVLKQTVVLGDPDQAAELTMRCLAEGTPTLTIFQQAIVAGIHEAGRLWDAGQYYVPDVIMSAEAFKAAVRIVGQHLDPGAGARRGKVVIGVVEGDVHDLGKNVVAAMLQGEGFQVVDLGVDVEVEQFVAAVRAEQPDILGVGAYMSTTMAFIGDVIRALEKAGLREQVRVMVGGVPTTQTFANQVGADAWGVDASNAVAQALKLIEEEGGEWQESEPRSSPVQP
jgi:methylmalonyl-CoA mutase cobalamin-binding domain/chain